MSLHLSYKKPFFHHVLENGDALFPGATSVLAYFYNKEKAGLDVYIRTIDLNEEVQNKAELDFDLLENYRKQRPRYSWISVLKQHENIGGSQLKIQGEYNNHSLLIRFPNALDGLNDILLITFKNEDQIFRISDKKQKLSTDLKQSIASVYVRTLDVIKKQLENDQQIDAVLQAHTAQTGRKETEHMESLAGLQNDRDNLIRELVERKVKTLLSSDLVAVKWEDEAISYLASHYKDLESLEESVHKTLIIALNKGNGASDSISIGKSLVQLPVQSREKIKEPTLDTRYQRTLALLDRYEIAAGEVLKQKLNLTGSSLGAHLNPSISAAAISDAIRKHASKISYLLSNYPQRWTILRRHFKPIQNKLYASHLLDKQAS
jgi:hypothetical protein